LHFLAQQQGNYSSLDVTSPHLRNDPFWNSLPSNEGEAKVIAETKRIHRLQYSHRPI